MSARRSARRDLRRLSGVALTSLWLTSLGLPAVFSAPVSAGAAGSWVGDAPSVRLYTPGREVVSQPFLPPGTPMSAEITSVSWRFTPPPGSARLETRLCHPQRCLWLATPRGQSRALAGLAATGPFVMRFRLPESARPSAPLRIEGLQLIVNYH
ncbi:flagellar protein FlhE [Modicisalibacter zincidurans]|uniref:Flagellar protein FlhE n=1 Tax=Modicisalibacter zincidurans TaxID=1178777 RepID=A0ABP9RCG6_9GAMM|nr:flagellar protein FlhE [Halomonas zincidurans]